MEKSGYKVVQLLPADGWREVLWNFAGGEVRTTTRPVIAWALIEDEQGTRSIDCVRGEDFLTGSGARDGVRGVDSYFEFGWTMMGACLGFVPEGEDLEMDYHLIAELHADREDPDRSLRNGMRDQKKNTILDLTLEYGRRLVAEGLTPEEVGRQLGMPKTLVDMLRG